MKRAKKRSSRMEEEPTMRPRFNCPAAIVRTCFPLPSFSFLFSVFFKGNVSEANRDAAADPHGILETFSWRIFFPWRDTWLRTQRDATPTRDDRSRTHASQIPSVTYLFSRRRNDVLEPGKRACIRYIYTCNASSSFPPPVVILQRNDAVSRKRERRGKTRGENHRRNQTSSERWTRVTSWRERVTSHSVTLPLFLSSV